MNAEAPVPEADGVPGCRHPRETLEIFGQDSAVGTFEDAWRADRLHHAWLLRGPSGIGKATLAYRIARAVIAAPDADGGLFGADAAPERTLQTPAGCPVQARIAAGAEPRLFVLRREYLLDKKRFETQITVDNVRRLRRFLGLTSADGGWRVIVIDAADEMNVASANALLKFLEEPPSRTAFLLVSHAPAGLLPTIRSRCRTLDLAPLGPLDLDRALGATGAEVPPGQAAVLAELGTGSVGAALALVGQDGVELYSRLIGLMASGNVARRAMTELAEECAGRANADRFRTVLLLIQTLMARLARSAATGRVPPPAAPAEPDLVRAVASDPRQAAAWAETLARHSAASRHWLAVNLDPAQCVIDTFLELDATLGRVRAVAS